MADTTVQRERIELRFIEQEMRESFIDYSMSVIVQRALPDARDGLKPVHRRILHAMRELGLGPTRPYKKCATVVGDVLGKYHPHGDSAVYDTLVRMAQDFSMRYPLVDGQGNFGSIDGDSAAAYRYTEARLTPFAMELLEDLDQETVDFRPNFDGRLTEPEVLPSRLPQLLLNGTDGIAVGMATKIPPHNLTELLEATDHLVAHPDCSVEELMAFVEGPDFPTGGYIWGRQGIEDAYRTGRGLVEMRARMHLEEGSYGKKSLVVTELPYQVNKTRVIEQITRMVRRGRTDAITDLRDESDRDGIRLVIELKRDAEPRKLVKTLFKKTQLRYTFGVITLALVDGRPEEMDLKQALECFVEHRLEVIGRRAAFQLERSEERAHVVEGLLLALDDIDRVIELIRASRTPDAARKKLRKEFKLSERQADAILAMRLSQLTGLERINLKGELETLRARIEELRDLVEDEAARRRFLRRDLEELAARYADPRRTEILDRKDKKEFPLPSGGGGEATLVLLTRRGYVKAQPARNGRGLAGADALASREADFVRQAFFARASDRLLVVTARGHAHELPISELPRGTRSSRGKPLLDFVELEERDRPAAVLHVDDYEPGRFLLTATRMGQVKRTALEEYANIRSGGIIATGISKGDEVASALITDGTAEVLLATATGQAIRFREEEIRPMGRTAKGVKGIDLEKDDVVVSALAPRRDSELLAATARGFAKRVPFSEFRLQGRAGKGTGLLSDREKAGDLLGLLEVHGGDRVVWEREDGELTESPVSEAKEAGRTHTSALLAEPGEGRTFVEVHPVRSSPQVGMRQEGSAGAGETVRLEGAAASGRRGAGTAQPAEGQAELELGG